MMSTSSTSSSSVDPVMYAINSSLPANIVATRPELRLNDYTATRSTIWLRDPNRTLSGVFVAVQLVANSPPFFEQHPDALLAGGVGTTTNGKLVVSVIKPDGCALATCELREYVLITEDLEETAVKILESDSADTLRGLWKSNLEAVQDTPRQEVEQDLYRFMTSLYCRYASDDYKKMVAHLDHWRDSLRANTLLTDAQKVAAKCILVKMASHATQFFQMLRGMKRTISDTADDAALEFGQRYGIAGRHKLGFMALETLLRTGKVETIEITIANASDILPLQADVDHYLEAVEIASDTDEVEESDAWNMGPVRTVLETDEIVGPLRAVRRQLVIKEYPYPV